MNHSIDRPTLEALYRAMWTARQIDAMEQGLVNRGEAFFHVSGAGHEASATLAFHLIPEDLLHLHYRDKALAIARGMTAEDFFEGLFCKGAAQSAGRQMSAHYCHRRLNILPMCGPVGNSALQGVGAAAALREHEARPIALVSNGEGTTQEGEYLEALCEAARDGLPTLFLVEDNRWAISTGTTDKTFYSHDGRRRHEFHGIPIRHLDGSDPLACYVAFGEVVARMRHDRRPAIVVMHVERLANHTNADDQSVYRSAEEIRRSTERDPLARLRRDLLERDWSEAECDALERTTTREVAAAEASAYNGAEPVATLTAKAPLRVELTHPSRERRGAAGPVAMKDALRGVLHQRLTSDPRVTLCGQDIEDPKGDVFGVTRGLSTEFGGRVRNAPLSESTIVGAAIGRALAGERPVAFLQFADFLPLAYNQLVAELGSVHWRSNGAWQSPVIVMVPCGGYRAGLGPFHSHSFESVMTHAPGLDVVLPSTAADAAGLLNAAFESGRPTLFFYPKALLNDSTYATTPDVATQFVPLGVARKSRPGRDITLVAWGNTVPLCERAAVELEQAGVEAEVLDLRSLSPWDERAVIASAEKTARLLVVHEDSHTCGFGAEVLATVAEKARVPVSLRRLTRPDTLVPCNFANQLEVLPSLRRVVDVCAEMLDLDVAWALPAEPTGNVAHIEAIGSGPSDESVTVVELLLEPGQKILRGDVVGSLEATKSVFEFSSPYGGVVEEVLTAPGDVVPVGQPLVRLRTNETGRRKPITVERPGKPTFTRRHPSGRIRLPRQFTERRPYGVGMSSVATVTGSRIVSNDELLRGRDGVTSEDIVRRTGIERRRWAVGGESAVEMAVRACWSLLEREGLLLDDLDLVVCSTTSPNAVTPSMACQVLNGIGRGKSDSMIQAYDINAACSGYLYALQAGYDYLQSEPEGRVLLVTAEVLSPLLDPDDFDTAILFGDATSATILYGEAHLDAARARVFRPELSAKGEDGSTLSVPFRDAGFIQMKGRRVFTEAVRSMVASLNRACHKRELTVEDLSLVVPHQANQRIIDAIQGRLSVPVFSNIREHGNTSSTSIPLCLAEVLPRTKPGELLGLCAFGGGFTFGAGIIQA